MLFDVDTLVVLQRERYADFQRQVDLLRLIRLQNKADKPSQRTATPGRAWANVLVTWQQMVWAGLQTHIRAVLPR